MSFLHLQAVEKYFGELHAIKAIDLSIDKNQFVVFVGPSGCGKSTLLRLIAGLENMDSGSVYLDGQEITHLPSSQRNLAMVFQSYALYPHMSVFDNMSFALRLAKVPKKHMDDKVTRAAEILHLTPYLDRMPRQLSGGQRQRVAIGRAIVRDPKAFLFDEPLSNLDAALRGQTRVELAKLHRELHATTIYVTHDQVEAMTLADRVVVLRDGRIEQTGSPLALYDTPANTFVAQFIGTPAMNILPLDQIGADIHKHAPTTCTHVGIRAESVSISEATTNNVHAQVDLIEVLGAETFIYLSTDAGANWVVRQNHRSELQSGQQVGLQASLDKVHWFDSYGIAITRSSTGIV